MRKVAVPKNPKNSWDLDNHEQDGPQSALCKWYQSSIFTDFWSFDLNNFENKTLFVIAQVANSKILGLAVELFEVFLDNKF